MLRTRAVVPFPTESRAAKWRLRGRSLGTVGRLLTGLSLEGGCRPVPEPARMLDAK
jgi:hypothetical protein